MMPLFFLKREICIHYHNASIETAKECIIKSEEKAKGNLMEHLHLRVRQVKSLPFEGNEKGMGKDNWCGLKKLRIEIKEILSENLAK